MTVKELIEALSKEDPDRLVVMSRDGEGNSYSPLSSCARLGYSWSGCVGQEELTPELEKMGFTEEDLAPSDAVPALVLWPVKA